MSAQDRFRFVAEAGPPDDLAEGEAEGRKASPAADPRDLLASVASVPLEAIPAHIALLKEAAPRKGFFEREQLDALLPHLPESVRPVIEVAYITGWRVRSEILTRKWQHVDFKGGWLRLDSGETKNAEARSFAFTPELRSVLERQRALASAIEQETGKRVESVFFRPDGTRIKYFRRSWLSACEKARLVAKISHDFRRKAVRNLARIGVDRKTAWRWSATRPKASTAGTRSRMKQCCAMPPPDWPCSIRRSARTAKVQPKSVRTRALRPGGPTR